MAPWMQGSIYIFLPCLTHELSKKVKKMRMLHAVGISVPADVNWLECGVLEQLIGRELQVKV